MKKVLFVCMGNICRSPMAEGLFRHKVRQLNLSIVIDSAGTHGYHQGCQYDKRAVATLKTRGISLKGYTSRKIRQSDFDEFDVVFVADRQNLSDLQQNFDSSFLSNVVLMTAFSKEYLNQDIPDPYYGDSEDFETAYQMLNEAIDSWLKHKGFLHKNGDLKY